MLAGVPRARNENVLVGFETADDAGVYRLTPELALVQTLDFFTPIVDDPYTFGAIAAANSLSDVYAMGGRPLSALSIVAYPAHGDLDDLQQILKGGAEKMIEAECALLGGHSVADDEIKFGYAVTGTVHPERVKPNAGARAGDALVFTKPIGTGVIGTALKRGIAGGGHVQAAVDSMLQLNRRACERMLEFDVHGCTDITGFGLIGHAVHVAEASEATLVFEAESLPLFERVEQLALAGHVPGGGRNNRSYFEPRTRIAPEVPEGLQLAAFDPQTSGGLLLAVPGSEAAGLLQALRAAGWSAAERVGTVAPRGAHAVELH